MDLMIYMMILLLSLEQVANLPTQRRRKLQPKFLPTPTNITVHRGELAVLKCHIRDLGPKIVVWRKQTNDVPFTIGETMFSQEDNMAIEIQKLSEDETQYDLIIKDVEPMHSGTYLCQVTATKLYTHYITLTVLDEPVKVEKRIKLTGTKFVNQDEQIKLRCNVTGISRAPDDVDWFFNGERILASLPHWRDRTQILRRTMGKMYISELIVERSSLNDDGTYVCRSSGNSDIDVDSFVVNVLSGTLILTAIETTEKPNSSRIKKANLSHSSDPQSSSSSAVFQHFTIFHLVVLTLCVITSLTSNCFMNYTTDEMCYLMTISNYDHNMHR